MVLHKTVFFSLSLYFKNQTVNTKFVQNSLKFDTGHATLQYNQNLYNVMYSQNILAGSYVYTHTCIKEIKLLFFFFKFRK